MIGAHATLEALEKSARGHQVIHLATHGFASAERPLESYLVLAPSACEDRLSARRAMARMGFRSPPLPGKNLTIYGAG